MGDRTRASWAARSSASASRTRLAVAVGDRRAPRSRRSRGPRSAARTAARSARPLPPTARARPPRPRPPCRSRRAGRGTAPPAARSPPPRVPPAASASRFAARAALGGRPILLRAQGRDQRRVDPPAGRGARARHARSGGDPEVVRQERRVRSPRRRDMRLRMGGHRRRQLYSATAHRAHAPRVSAHACRDCADAPPLASSACLLSSIAIRQPRGRARRPARRRRRSRSACASWASSAACSTSPPTPTTRTPALLTYLANGALVRTGYLSMTRGDGGQNLIGSEQGPALGAHPHAGAAGRPPHRRRRAVLHPRARLRLLEEPRRDPAHLGQGRGAGRHGGGHPPLPARRDRHALFARPGRHPRPPHRLGDAGAGGVPRRRRSEVPPRAAHRRRHALAGAPPAAGTGRRGRSSRATSCRGVIKLDVGGYSPLLGASFGEIAADSRSMHKSQGFGVARSRGPSVEYFARSRRRPAAGPAADDARRTCFDGIDLDLEARSRAAAKVGGAGRARGRASSIPRRRSHSIPALLAVDARAGRLAPMPRWRDREAARGAAIWWSRARACSPRRPPPTTAARPAASLRDRRRPRSTARRRRRQAGRGPLAVDGSDARRAADALVGDGHGAAFEAKRPCRVPAGPAAVDALLAGSAPEAGLYRVADPALVGVPERAPPLAVDFTFAVAGRRFKLSSSARSTTSGPTR